MIDTHDNHTIEDLRQSQSIAICEHCGEETGHEVLNFNDMVFCSEKCVDDYIFSQATNSDFKSFTDELKEDFIQFFGKETIYEVVTSGGFSEDKLNEELKNFATEHKEEFINFMKTGEI